jgi:penicillin amidase
MVILPVPPEDGTVTVGGIHDSLAITYDARGIPQVWASDHHDALFALGYLHASERMFQMDLFRRLAYGRLSEMVGSIAVDLDIQQRHLGHDRLAEAALDRLSDQNRAALQAYCDGVNSYVETARAMPFEFRLLPVDFEPWTVENCLALTSYQSWFSNALMNSDGYFRELTDMLGRDSAATYAPSYPDWAPTTIPRSYEMSAGPSDSLQPANDGLPCALADADSRPLWPAGAVGEAVMQSALAPAGGSNAWVVSPTRSQSGRAMLASDPHLEISRLPQFWYTAGIHAADGSIDALGITTPGLPFVIMGHNGATAWAFTVGGIDVNDYYRERINPGDSLEHMTPEGWAEMEVIVDTVHISDAAPREIRIKLTRHGPVMHRSDSPGHVYSLRWTGFDADLNAAVEAGLDLARISNFEEFRRTVTSLGALDASWMYADSGGNIGYQLGTPIAIRDPVTALLPPDGWTEGHEWRGYVPDDSMPHAVNPRQGWLAVCNSLPTRAMELPGTFAFDRITRANSLLDSLERYTPDDLERMQTDLVSSHWRRWREVLAVALEHNGDSAWADSARAWNGTCDLNSRVAPMMAIFMKKLKRSSFVAVGTDLSTGIPSSTMEDFWSPVLVTMHLDSVQLQQASRAARSALEWTRGRTMGQVQTLTMRHPMARVPVIGSLLGLERGPWPWRGAPGTLNASWFGQRDSTLVSSVGASWRFVIDFADVDSASMVLPAGNSGHPASDHFFDFFEMYRSGERWTVPFSEDAVRSRAAGTLVLQPDRNE